ncbi:LysR family transcriptional regulator [Nitratireductor mangrovi]|uniref:LysR family transcriptional regulator n=1 Tax=Nitratireductor mangrovi TaxID=2599600 RepID=A0A5B8KWH6_9HYPH|nr:LysR family transcriptional regulator [Nitratireductor mangrovi]QDZ00067.1 LysR family transcriptional regulator [Nitratireductor mangrovi]
MTELDWNLIRSFATVAETGSLSAAARTLSSSQPTLGRHIAELERRLGVTLFRRGRGGYALTDKGEALLGRALAMREHAAGFSRLALGAVEHVSGTVRIAASEVMSAYALPAILADLAAEEPGIEVEIVASNQVENLLRRDADIAVRMVEPTQLDLVARKVADIPLVACAAVSYLDRRGRLSGQEDLPAHDLVGFDRDDSIIDGFAQFGLDVDRHAFRFRTDNQIVYWQAILAGNGIGFFQEPLVANEPLVEALLPDLRLPALPMWLAMHRDVRTSARVRRTADFLHERLTRYVAG